jgi:hypothetical protein
MTIAEVLAYAGPQERITAVHAWAGDVWRAHAHQHDLVRRWIREPLRWPGSEQPGTKPSDCLPGEKRPRLLHLTTPQSRWNATP